MMPKPILPPGHPKPRQGQGNCWTPSVIYDCYKCGYNELCDVCHKHDAPRGSCPECPRCETCEREGAAPEPPR